MDVLNPYDDVKQEICTSYDSTPYPDNENLQIKVEDLDHTYDGIKQEICTSFDFTPYPDSEENLKIKIEDLDITEQFIDETGVHDRDATAVKYEYDCPNSISQETFESNYCFYQEGENRQQENKTKEKLIRCKYCNADMSTKNFTRHIERKHSSESEVIKLLELPKKSRERRNAFMLLRNDTNFNLFINGNVRPNHQKKTLIENNDLYYPCPYCKGLFLKRYLSRHAKRCIVKTQNNNRNFCSASQTLTACATVRTNIISKLSVKEQVFDLMTPDDISLEAKKDLLIIHFGESYLKNHKRVRKHYTCSSRMRELSRLLIAYRKISGEAQSSLKDLIVPRKFDTIVKAVRKITGYDPIGKTYKIPSLAIHLGTSMKHVCCELKNLILQESEGFRCGPNESIEEWIEDINNFIDLIESRWTIQITSPANKDLQERRWNKPLLSPLVDDVQKFKEESLKLAEKCVEEFAAGEANVIEDTCKREKICRKVWTDEEVQLLITEFGRHISKRVYPSSAEVQQMLEKTKLKRTVKVVKSKLQHLMKKRF